MHTTQSEERAPRTNYGKDFQIRALCEKDSEDNLMFCSEEMA